MLSIALKLLLRHIDRTAVTVLMLVPVVALLISSSMVTSGYLQQATTSISLVEPSNAYLAYQAGSPSPSASSMGYDAFVRIQGSGVSSATPVLSFPSAVTDRADTANASVLATNMTAFIAERQTVVYGKVAKADGQVDAGAIIARILDIKVGDSVQVDAFSEAQTLKVVGILNSTDESDTDLILPLSSSWTLWPQTMNKISYVEFVADSKAATPGIAGNVTVIREEGIDQIARSFDSQTSSLLTNWTYILFVLAAAAAIAAASRVVTEVSQEFNTIRALGARLSVARTLVFYELLMISGVAVLIGVSAGVVSSSVLGTLFKAIDGLPLAPSVNPVQLIVVGVAAFLFILAAGSISLAWLPRKIGGTGDGA